MGRASILAHNPHIYRQLGLSMADQVSATGPAPPPRGREAEALPRPEFYGAFMKCKSPRCEFERGHRGLCSYLIRNQPVTTPEVTCNHCVTKDEEIARLRNQIAEMELKGRPKRERAQYMRAYRAKAVGIAYG